MPAPDSNPLQTHTGTSPAGASLSLNASLPQVPSIRELGYKQSRISPDTEVLSISVTGYKQHARLIYSISSREAVIVDPGGEAPKIIGLADKFSLKPNAIWLTHSHPDHCGGVRDIKKHYGIPLLAHTHRLEAIFRKAVTIGNILNGRQEPTMKNCPSVDIPLRDGDILRAGGLDFTAILTPGHSPGHLCFYSAAAGTLISGDLAFQRGLAPTNFRGASRKILIQTVKFLVESLPEDTIVMPGHAGDMVLREWKKFI